MFTLALLCAAVSILMTACSSAPKCVSSGKQVVCKTGSRCILDKQCTVRVGMTKAEVISIWGMPSTRIINSKGESWTWAGNSWKRVLPLIGDHFNTETYSADFSPEGKVTDYKVINHYGHPFMEECTSGTLLPSTGTR